MIKIKVKEGKSKAEASGAVIDLIADAGVVIWALKDMITREKWMPVEDMKTYLTAFVLADKQEDVVEFLKKINF
jgi:hypothetical protein